MKPGEDRGFALIDLLFVCGIIGVLAVIATPRLLLAKQTAGSASAIGSLRAINSAELSFALTCGGGFYAPALTELGHPPAGSPQAFISPSLASADTVTRSGYLIQVSGTPFPGAPGSCNGVAAGALAQGIKAGAEPSDAGNPRYFATNANAQIFEHSSSLFTVMPEVGEPPVGHPLR
jgi:type II secretory pathway pseudopilin PulG